MMSDVQSLARALIEGGVSVPDTALRDKLNKMAYPDDNDSDNDEVTDDHQPVDSGAKSDAPPADAKTANSTSNPSGGKK